MIYKYYYYLKIKNLFAELSESLQPIEIAQISKCCVSQYELSVFHEIFS